AEKALEKWQKAHPNQSFGDKFWMTGEAWGHGVHTSDYYNNGFDAMINFSFQDQAKEALGCFAKIAPTYQQMSEKLKDLNVLSYLSSHDTRLFFHDDSQNNLDKQKTAGSLLLLSPGAVQIYYGDESGRKFGATGSDPIQGTRSDMNWQELDSNSQNKALQQHWAKVALFRQNHAAIGDGEQKVLETKKYFAFSRRNANDKVMVVWAGK
ncbi:alpha-amylase family glycosyl hydrolase, partial [Glaesserella sp.]|uniref:alpha-amylase family glycosyl hydrolase n=1 Tax=Glaesserella sp. TaxID=2094731 RepID=UPI0035A092E8